MKLSTLYQELGPDERKKLAADAGTSTAYLWQIATGWVNGDGKKARPSVDLIAALAKADPRLTVVEMVAEFANDKAEA